MRENHWTSVVPSIFPIFSRPWTPWRVTEPHGGLPGSVLCGTFHRGSRWPEDAHKKHRYFMVEHIDHYSNNFINQNIYIYIINYKSLLILTWGVESISCGNLWNTGMSPGLVVDFRAPCPHPTNWKHRNAKLFDIQRWMPKILQIGYYQWEIMGTPMVWGTILELYARSIGWSLHVVYIWKHSPFVFACPIGKA